MGTYCGMDERDLFAMEYRTLQHTKLQGDKALPMARQVALMHRALQEQSAPGLPRSCWSKAVMLPSPICRGRRWHGSLKNSRHGLEPGYWQSLWTLQTRPPLRRISVLSYAHGAGSI